MSFTQTLKIRLFGFFKIPLIGFTSPQVLELSNRRVEISIPLNRRTRNHIKTMYFGALSVGADLCIGLLALHHIEKKAYKQTLVFKDFHIDFHKTAKAKVHFVCEAGHEIGELVEKAHSTKERQNQKFTGQAFCPSISKEPVATFTLTLSLKENGPSK